MTITEKDFPIKQVNKSITIRKRICQGHLYCIFEQGKDGEFKKLHIKGSTKATPCGESWIDPMSKIITFALRRALWEGSAQQGILKHLFGHRCNECAVNADRTTSCTDAIAKSVDEYLKNHDSIALA